MKKWLLVAILCCAMLVGCGADDMSTTVVVTKPERKENVEYVQMLERTPIAKVEGETLSPNEKYQILTNGAGENVISGVRLPETLQIIDTETDGVLWEDAGYIWQSALWSPDGDYLALAYAGRTWNQILFFETDTWTTWQFTMPDGNAIPEYTFLPEDWGVWTDENTIQLTVGRGGDGEEQKSYRCSVIMDGGQLTGHTLEETAEVLDTNYDFDHDGAAERVEIVTLWSPELPDRAAWYELQVKKEDGTLLWKRDAAESHVGWTSIFAIEIDGHDYLLRYDPGMWQGVAYYQYQIFSLNEAGEEVLLKENGVEFDVNFGSPIHMGFDAGNIAEFLWEIKALLADSRLLISTENGVYASDLPGTEFENAYCYGDLLKLDSREAIQTALEREKEMNMPEVRVLNGGYDFDHDGVNESVVLEGNNRTIEESSFWGLKVMEEDRVLWFDTAATSHAGWNNLFALRIDGQDYLLRYQPSMWQGIADYHYWIFSLNEIGDEVILRENHVEFDDNFQSAHHQGFDPAAIAAFLEEVHGYLGESTLLLSTESGSFRSGGNGAEFQEDGFFWDEFCPYDPSMTLEENVRNFQKCRMDA